ncbi:hypothetical protein GOFOIKOB_0503 [Methylobacterium tardum]|uniref:Uncharacterized protein n=1 Tax=Methylobacterium tardum TaxID=374432 RepID=A0AA37WTG2_9HYPH|nr:hypothetical protein [Methylobacterium tardum]URD37019.1 hypothetical protein M6G65_32880 [Methylobacterium tardum]GJE47480.1 hypothetical protein GOFOIKOB_0503 [Methylobacterium tardum]GLS71142.1 hypothetical protein GCM10007890_31550 [Methylobacterium tardum]
MKIRIAAALILAAIPAVAQTRPSSTTMTCQQTVRLIQARGALVLGTGGMTYDRFVRDRSFCEPTEIAKRAFRPTRDNPNCLIGYTCYELGPGDWPGEDF